MANKVWIGANGNLTSSWDIGSNWDVGTIPGAADSAIINAAGTGAYTVTENANTSIGSLTINSVNATLSISDVTLSVTNATTVTQGMLTFADPGSKLTTLTFLINSGTFSEAQGLLDVTGSGLAFLVDRGLFNLSGGAVTVAATSSFTGGIDTISSGAFTTGALAISGATTDFSISGGTVTTTADSPTAGTIASGATLNMNGSGVLDFTDAGINSTAGLQVAGSLIGTGTVKGVLSNSGIVDALGGTLDLTSNIAPDGSLHFVLGSGGQTVMQLDGTVGANNTFTFLGAGGTLAYNNATQGIHENIVGLVAGSSIIAPAGAIDFEQYTVTVVGSNAHTGSSGTINLSDGSVLNLSGISTSQPWFVNTISDGGSGTDVFIGTVCYVAGTSILTPTGERMVESLMQGDIVVTVSDEDLIESPVKWLGQRRIDLATHPRPETVAPIRIERGAFSDNVPHNDLLVSPDHAIFVDGKLICARQLTNGTTIRQESGWTSVEYFHVELETHAILLAEGLPSESYLDTGNRGFFANSADPLLLHPDLTDETDYPTREASSCAPFVTDERNVQPVWQRLVERAETLGHPLPRLNTSTDARLHVVVDGRAVKPIRGENGLYIFILPKGSTEARVVSCAGAPSDVRPWLGDCRVLGVSVERILLRYGNEVQRVPLDHPDLSQGWWAVERDGVLMRRWTDGNAVLPLPSCNGPIMLEIHASSGEMAYLTDAQQERRAA